MSNSKEMIVLVFNDEIKADQALSLIRQQIDAGVISVLNVVILVRSNEGKTRVQELQEVGATQGALFGAITGGLIGLLGGPAGAVIGAVAGATTGGVAAYAFDSGFSDKYLQELKAYLQPGTSAAIILCRQTWSDKILETVAPLQGHLIRHVLQEEIAAHLAAIKFVDDRPLSTPDETAQLEREIATRQAEIEQLMVNLTTDRSATQTEIRMKISQLHIQQHRAQEKLYKLWTDEIRAHTTRIEALTAELKHIPVEAQPDYTSQIEATRARRRLVREKLYAQMEQRIGQWQSEIEALKERTTLKSEADYPLAKRTTALNIFTSVFKEAEPPRLETEAKTRLVALQNLAEAAETEIQTQLEANIAIWEEAIKDLQAYEAIPGVRDKAEVHNRIATLQEQIDTARFRLKARIEAQITAWITEMNDLRTQVAQVGAAERKKVKDQIAELKAQIKDLEIRVAAAGTPERVDLETRLAVLQDRAAVAKAKLQHLEQNTSSVYLN